MFEHQALLISFSEQNIIGVKIGIKNILIVLLPL